MADAIVSAVLQQLLTIVDREAEQEVRLVVGVKKEVEKMRTTFQTIQAVLVDAEKRQFKEEAVRVWLGKLKHIYYDIDDVLDEWNTAILKSQIEGRHQTPSTDSSPLSQVYSCIPSPCSCFGGLALRRDIGVKIRELNERLQAISKEKDDFAFLVNTSDNDLESERPPKTTHFVDVSEIRGRDQDRDTVISMLLNESNPPIISIVGMGGIGKTTLAQVVYNHHEIGSYFQKKIWVCVSDRFDEMRVAKAILESLTNSASSFDELTTVLQNIHESIAGKRYLLVLDDVWNEDEQKWRSLKLCLLNNGSQGSKILVTTRKADVATIMGCTQLLHLEKLSPDECWFLFSGIAFSGRAESDRVSLEDIGKKIAKRCKGLPLAAKTLGGLLRRKRSREQWERILNSHLWELDVVDKRLFSPLLLSYYDLPAPIRRCFSYCAIFPKNHVIGKDLLIKLWMAQGYLSGAGGNEMEIVGEEYFDNLASRSFFQEFGKDEDDESIIKYCKMHDIVHDFAQLLRKDECRVMLASNAMEESTTDFYDENVRHLTSMRDRLEIPDPTYNLKKLRTLFLDEFLSFPGDKEILDVCLLKLFDQSTCLRVLYLRSKLIEKVPQEIGKLIHLRYLSLDECTGLRELPEALCDLCNLQTLNIKMCFGLESLPRGMEKLINLRHLGNGGTCGIRFMPEGMGRLTSLQTLDEFVVNESETDSCRLEDLGKFIHLRGHLTIRRLGNYAGEGGSEARLSTKLRSLGLDFNGGYDKEAQKAIEDEASLMQALEPPQHLRSLQIEYCKGIVFPFPNWMTLLTSLKSVTLIHCWNWESLPPMGKLRFLESLSIWDMRKVKKVGEEFLGVETKDGQTSTNNNIVAYFPNLKKLEFKGMHEWEEWEYELRNRGGDESCSSSSSTIPTIIMPKLQCLDIEGCPKLKKLPRHILQSRALQQLKIPYCDILYKRYDKEAGDDWPSISHIPQVQTFPQLEMLRMSNNSSCQMGYAPAY